MSEDSTFHIIVVRLDALHDGTKLYFKAYEGVGMGAKVLN